MTTIMVFPEVGASGPDFGVDDVQSNLLRGTVTNLKVRTTTSSVPRSITSKGWVVGRMERGDYLLDSTETYSLDTTGSATSNKNKKPSIKWWPGGGSCWSTRDSRTTRSSRRLWMVGNLSTSPANPSGGLSNPHH